MQTLEELIREGAEKVAAQKAEQERVDAERADHARAEAAADCAYFLDAVKAILPEALHPFIADNAGNGNWQNAEIAAPNCVPIHFRMTRNLQRPNEAWKKEGRFRVGRVKTRDLSDAHLWDGDEVDDPHRVEVEFYEYDHGVEDIAIALAIACEYGTEQARLEAEAKQLNAEFIKARDELRSANHAKWEREQASRDAALNQPMPEPTADEILLDALREFVQANQSE